MLKKPYRLSKKEFEVIISGGKAIHCPIFTFVYISSTNKNMGLSAVASKKNFKTAVQRNKIRRRIYGSIERVIHGQVLPIQGIFLAKTAIIKADSGVIDLNIHQIFVKLGLLK